MAAISVDDLVLALIKNHLILRCLDLKKALLMLNGETVDENLGEDWITGISAVVYLSFVNLVDNPLPFTTPEDLAKLPILMRVSGYNNNDDHVGFDIVLPNSKVSRSRLWGKLYEENENDPDLTEGTLSGLLDLLSGTFRSIDYDHDDSDVIFPDVRDYDLEGAKYDDDNPYCHIVRDHCVLNSIWSSASFCAALKLTRGELKIELGSDAGACIRRVVAVFKMMKDETYTTDFDIVRMPVSVRVTGFYGRYDFFELYISLENSKLSQEELFQKFLNPIGDEGQFTEYTFYGWEEISKFESDPEQNGHDLDPELVLDSAEIAEGLVRLFSGKFGFVSGPR